MARVATAECVKCHKIFPKTQMNSRTETRKSTRKTNPRDVTGHFHGNTSRGTTYTSEKQVWVCDECGTSEFKAYIGGAIVLALGWAGYHYLWQGSKHLNAAPIAQVRQARSDVNGDTSPTPASHRHQALDESAPSDAYIAPPADAADPAATASQSDSSITAAIQAATIDALTTGETAKWHKHGQKGYVVVSAEQTYADKTCRNVTVTTLSGSEQSQADPVMWCKASGQDSWRPSNG